MLAFCLMTQLVYEWFFFFSPISALSGLFIFLSLLDDFHPHADVF